MGIMNSAPDEGCAKKKTCDLGAALALNPMSINTWRSCPNEMPELRILGALAMGSRVDVVFQSCDHLDCPVIELVAKGDMDLYRFSAGKHDGRTELQEIRLDIKPKT